MADYRAVPCRVTKNVSAQKELDSASYVTVAAAGELLSGYESNHIKFERCGLLDHRKSGGCLWGKTGRSIWARI